MRRPLPIPSERAKFTDSYGGATTHGRRYFDSLNNSVDDLISASAVKAGVSQTDRLVVFVAKPANGDTKLLRPFPNGATITEVRTQSTSGTCTLTVKINSTALGGTANSVSTSEQGQAHSSANVLDADDNLVLTVSSNSSCAGMTVTISYTVSLSA